MGSQVGVRAKPLPMFSRHVLRRVVLLMDVQQGGLQQGEQQHRRKQHPKQGIHWPLF